MGQLCMTDYQINHYFFKFLLLCVYECFACVYVHLYMCAWCLKGPEYGVRHPVTEVRRYRCYDQWY